MARRLLVGLLLALAVTGCAQPAAPVAPTAIPDTPRLTDRQVISLVADRLPRGSSEQRLLLRRATAQYEGADRWTVRFPRSASADLTWNVIGGVVTPDDRARRYERDAFR